jgi:Flp pilus assembly protein TadD
MEAPLEAAQRQSALGDVAGALAAYSLALERNRQNWTVVAAAATFMNEHGIDGAVDVARHAVATNPWYATSLWVLLGDCLFKVDDLAGARSAFEKALQIDPAEVAAHHGLSYVHASENRFKDAAEILLAGLLADRRGVGRGAMMQLLSTLLASISEAAAQGDRRMMRRSQAFESA